MSRIFGTNHILLAVLSVACGIFVLAVPSQITLITLLALIICIGFFKFPKTILVTLSAYLLLQQFIAYQFKTRLNWMR